MTLDTESEQFEAILGEALRAGPASPAWQQAVDLLKAQGHGGDDWSLLVKARQRLESGRAYRAVRPGSGFTRKLMQRIDETPQSSSSGLSTGSLLMALGVLVILSIVGILGWLLLSPSQDHEGRLDLRNALFVGTLLEHDFSQPVPSGWKRIGSLPLATRDGLRLAPSTAPSEDYMGGGIVLPLTLGAREPFAFEATIDIAGKPGTSVAQLFVSESDTFSPDRGTSPRELVFQLDQKGSRVVPPGGQGVGDRESPGKTRTVTVRVLVSRDKCLVEQDGRTLWAGDHGLSQELSRYLGIRLLARGTPQRDAIAIRSIIVRKP